MPFRRPVRLAVVPRLRPIPVRNFHASCVCRHDAPSTRTHYDTLKVSPDASPAEIKRSFYTLSKVLHPDHNRNDPQASQKFTLISEAYSVLGTPAKRRAYDRDVLRLHASSGQAPRGSYHSTGHAGGRPASGLSRRRGSFRGPPPSFYRSGGWGAHEAKRAAAHEETTSGGRRPSHHRGAYAGMGPGQDPFAHRGEEVRHFDKASHQRAQGREDERRARRRGDDDIEIVAEISPTGHFFVIVGILLSTVLVPLLFSGALWTSDRPRDREKERKKSKS